ncbi:putative RNA-binding protein [Trypanosoma cruzi]|uniref:RNA-binding protein, putative n=2 Tax=Trypanosoma cruzi TaxID=5693 RepID=Q4CY48_TRYCC|nr:RNA-binding protein, putative [Trypanosoma cruzi]EAN85200.1 RNA-binding protein, putative [Trypanosoma cruzi]KAF8303463.1 putative RNA-binding protein [Trypanosoma cruzi]PWV07002.1 putative RNA-binding protein [Trypanosoma cruzi]RNC53613.1 RNA-binding protein [Trypanosoma cruzi]|eukprot:XP_807051.1 RNA-binding protein [Trypanosoma cruzi strain CL Brener]
MSFDSPYNRNVYIASLPANYTDEELHALFAPFGRIVSTALVKDKNKGRCKGYGFVLMERYQDAYNAVIALQGHTIAHTRVQVRLARPEASAKRIYPLYCQQATISNTVSPTYVLLVPQPYIMSQ